MIQLHTLLLLLAWVSVQADNGAVRGGAFAGQRMDGGFQNRQLASMKMMGKGKGKGKGKGSSMSSSKGSSSKSKKKNGFTIELMNMGDNTDYDELFSRAARRWEEVIVGDLLDVPAQNPDEFDWFGGQFETSYAGEVDDMVIGYAFYPTEFFSRNTTLGSAGPRFVRNFSNRRTLPLTTISGVMRFNFELMNELEFTDNDIYAVILHEMGHVIGVGTPGWAYNCARSCFESLNETEGTFVLDDDGYRCPKANEAFYSLGLKTYYEKDIPLLVNQEGGLGSVCAHWAEQSFNMTGVNSELMTPFYDAGVPSPLSTVTIGAVEDLGYEVNYHAADDFPKEAYYDGELLGRRGRRLQTGRGTGVVTDHTFNLLELMDDDSDSDLGYFRPYEY